MHLPIGFVGSGKKTYIYLNGLRPREEVSLGDGVLLLPASCRPLPEDIITKSKSEIDIGVACIFLRSISACFLITADTPKELAARAWSSQWDAVLLSALLDCEVGYPFQSNMPPEEFSKASEFHVTNYELRGLNAEKVRQITPNDQKWIVANYGKAKKLMDDDRYRDAVHSLSSYRWHSVPSAQLALIWSGIEGLFNVDQELSFRLSLYIARFLSPRRGLRQKSAFAAAKKLYSIRSKAVHGRKIENPYESAREPAKLLRHLVVKCAEQEGLPNIDDLAP